MSASFHSIAGGWLGTFYYASRTLLPVRFEASFVRQAGDGDTEQFCGSVVDDDNGDGVAQVAHGVRQAAFIRFTKRYMPPAPGLYPVAYVGTLSADGRLLTGHWKIALAGSRRARARELVGTWDARRVWTADTDDAA